MSKYMFAALVIGLVIALGAAAADIPKTISFQGKLSSSVGKPLNGNYDITIRIYDSMPMLLFQESHPGTAVTAGVFNVLIGSRTVGGVPSDVFSTPDTSAGIAVGTDAEMKPRLPLGAVPYAYRAEMAQAIEVPMSITVANTSALLTLNNTSSGNAILGISTGGNGVYAISTTNYGAYAVSSNGPGAIYGQAGRTGAFAIKGAATSNSGSTVGVMGEAMNSSSGVGVVGNGGDRGVQGYGYAGHGVYGQTAATSGAVWGGYFTGNSSLGGGVYGESNGGVGVKGKHTNTSLTSPGVYGENTGSGDGVLGRATNANGAGIHGEHYGSGPGGKFSSASGVAVLAEGEVKADKLSYNTPRTHYLRVGPCDFVPGSDDTYINGWSQPGAYLLHVGEGAMVAGVQLPHGATVTKFTAYYRDNAAGDLTITLHRFFNTGTDWLTMASVATSGTPDYGGGQDPSISDPVINNLSYSYCVRAYSTSWPGDSTFKVMGAVIEYTIDEAE